MMSMFRAAIACGALALCGVGVSHAQDGLYYTPAQSSEINCVFAGVLASADQGAMIGTLALSERESAYNVEMLNERLTPFVDACMKQYGWTDEQAQLARAVGAAGAAMQTQVMMAVGAGATTDEMRKTLALIDELPVDVRRSLASASRLDDAMRAMLVDRIQAAGLAPTDDAMGELVYVLKLGVQGRETQRAFGNSLFS